jgi:hypothetical protein
MKSAFVIVLLLGIVIGHSAGASEEFDFGRDVISDKWFAGSSLVFDCENRHWVCVAPEDHQQCAQARERTLIKGKRELACAPAEVYQKRADCHETLRRMVSEGNAYPRVCLHPNERSRIIGFR